MPDLGRKYTGWSEHLIILANNEVLKITKINFFKCNYGACQRDMGMTAFVGQSWNNFRTKLDGIGL